MAGRGADPDVVFVPEWEINTLLCPVGEGEGGKLIGGEIQDIGVGRHTDHW